MAGLSGGELFFLGIVIGMIVTLVVILSMTKLVDRNEDRK